MTKFIRATVPQSERNIAVEGIVDAWRRRDPAVIAMIAEDASEADARRTASEVCDDEIAGTEVWINDTYQVSVRHLKDLVHLSIKRIDREPCQDWRDFQEIKNQLVGPECEGVELYPAESRKVDAANQYHLFVVPNATYRFPFGFTVRAVSGGAIGHSKQRAFA